MLTTLLKSLVIGLAIAAPVGPIGILCIQRTLQSGFTIGLMTGLGAALADGIYGVIAVFGLTAISTFLITEQFWIHLFGGLFLLYLGIKLLIICTSIKTSTHTIEHYAWHAITTTFFLTLTNPMTILSFIAIFAGLGLSTLHNNYLQASILVSGIILGSAIWWFFLSFTVAFLLRHRLNTKTMRLINKLAGLIILLFGIYALFSIYK